MKVVILCGGRGTRLKEETEVRPKPLEKLASEKELMVYTHEDFWQCMDTYRELEILNNLYRSPKPPWKVWRD